jgi:hypothetical protein
MKPFSSLATLAVASLATSSMAYTCPNGFTPIVRMTIDTPVSPVDATMIEEAVVSSTPTRRNLRDGRQLWPSYCKSLCLGFPPAQCFLAFSACTVRRQMAGDGQDIHAGSDGIPYRMLAIESCTEVKTAVTQAVTDVAPELSTLAGAAVENARMACFCVDATGAN